MTATQPTSCESLPTSVQGIVLCLVTVKLNHGSTLCEESKSVFGVAGVKATKATGIPKPRTAVDRAKKAEATFAARRAAALAKVKK